MQVGSDLEVVTDDNSQVVADDKLQVVADDKVFADDKLLSHNLDDADEDELAQPALRVEIDLSLSALANAGLYYANKKKTGQKREKTVAANAKALKAAGKKSEKKGAKVEKLAGRGVQQMRSTYWFEKFSWFVTSENYLVLCGLGATQNELLVKRYLRAGDAYVHADLHGAGSIVVKNPNSATPIPERSLGEAGALAVCRSKAWCVVIWVLSFQ